MPPFQSPDTHSSIDQRPSLRESHLMYSENDVPHATDSPNYVSNIESEGPEVVTSWVYDQERINSPLSTDGTVVSAYQSVRFDEKGGPIGLAVSEAEAPPQKSRRRTRWLWGIGVLVLLVLIGVGLGVGLTLGMKKSAEDSSAEVHPDLYCAQNPQYCIGGSIDSRYYSTRGAFNGSGIAVAGESWDENTRRFLTLYFQHHTGALRWMYQGPNGGWQGGTSSEIVAGNAKNATPISVVAYVDKSGSTDVTVHHLFYIARDGFVKERVYRNDSATWEDGPLNSLDIKAYSAPNVGMQACWYGNYYGDSDISDTENVPYNTPGMHLWYPKDESNFEQWGWYLGKTPSQWKRSKDQDQLPWKDKNTHAGVGCYSWGPTNTTYAMMVNQYNGVEVWWKDTDKNTLTSDVHPINTWTNATGAAFPGVHPNTSLGYTDFFYTQMQNGSIMGRNIIWAAENTTIMDNETFTIGDPKKPWLGLNGTHMTNTAVQTNSGGVQLLSFYQTDGSDITLFKRDKVGGDWDKKSLDIPDD